MIVVFGSLNVDLVTRVARIPGPGETVLGPSYEAIPGGKGANQALAAARAGASVRMVGAVGRDGFAGIATALLRDAGVDLAGVVETDAPTGAAFITLDDGGENSIVVASGANARAKADALRTVAMSAGDTLLMQRELPPVETSAAAHAARATGVRTVLNAAPSGGFDAAILADVNVLIVNEHEAGDVARALGWSDAAPEAVARRLAKERGMIAVATLGGEGVVGWSGGERRAILAPPVKVVDTTGAGDAFCGVFAAGLDRGLGWGDAMKLGVAAGSLACTTIGAQPSLPRRAEIERLAATLA